MVFSGIIRRTTRTRAPSPRACVCSTSASAGFDDKAHPRGAAGWGEEDTLRRLAVMPTKDGCLTSRSTHGSFPGPAPPQLSFVITLSRVQVFLGFLLEEGDFRASSLPDALGRLPTLRSLEGRREEADTLRWFFLPVVIPGLRSDSITLSVCEGSSFSCTFLPERRWKEWGHPPVLVYYLCTRLGAGRCLCLAVTLTGTERQHTVRI